MPPSRLKIYMPSSDLLLLLLRPSETRKAGFADNQHIEGLWVHPFSGAVQVGAPGRGSRSGLQVRAPGQCCRSGLQVGVAGRGQLAQHSAAPPGRYSLTVSIADKLFIQDTFSHTHPPEDSTRTQIVIFWGKIGSSTDFAFSS